MIKKNKNISLKRPYVLVPLCIDFLHHGHLNVLIKAKKLGSVIVALMSDEGILSYKKKKPYIKYKNRKKIIQHIDCVSLVVKLNKLDFASIAKKYKVEFLVHGDDWKKGPQKLARLAIIETMNKWKGKVIDIPYTKEISSSYIKNKLTK
ncbi:adenylyltransferase/cytidyltransferase family protein [Pelagibacteraceae bacterium]|nr:adenylyltransferase/cytidyltransferase family protein [Pelagibacteraceae bacterium]